MAYSAMIAAYERYLLGQSTILLPGDTEAEKNAGAKEVIRYAVTELLGWTPEEAVFHMTKEIMDQLKLTPYCENYLATPVDCIKEMDFDYIVAFCFDMPIDYKFQLSKHRRRIQLGLDAKYRKELFEGTLGAARAAYLLGEVISTSISIPMDGNKTNIEKLYERFSDYTKSDKILQKQGLFYVCHGLYATPLEYLHYSLDKENQDDLLFAVHEFKNVYRTTEKMEKKKNNQKKS